jgi:hypothetical protein
VDPADDRPEGTCEECRRDRDCANGLRCARDGLNRCLPLCGEADVCPADLACRYNDGRNRFCIPQDICGAED